MTRVTDRSSVALAGLSGFQIQVTASDEIRKSSAGGDGERLRRQCRKQQTFRVLHPKFHVCEVIRAGEVDGSFFFTMPFYRGDYATQFICKASPRRLMRLAQDLADLVDEMIAASPLQRVPAAIVRRKSEDTIEMVLARQAIPGLDELCAFHLRQLDAWAEFIVPVGRMHGDLTLSNMIFAADGQRYILIDFLDAYLETPLFDMAKLRQETKLAWSSLSASQVHDRVKYRIAMERLDEVFQGRFARHACFRDYIDVLDFQNLLRVLPYATDPLVVGSIVARLRELHAQAGIQR